ncbi:MAG: FG-GAP repeat domain-containing protein, partial [Phycisphaerales bacterium]
MTRVLNRWIRALAGRAESMEGLETRALMAATTFDAATTLLASNTLVSVAAEDMNSDGAVDVVSVDTNQTIGIYFADKDRRGEFSRPLSIGLPSLVEDFAVVDWDGDGDKDVVLAPESGSGVLLVERLSNGAFTNAVPLTSVSAMGSNRRLVVGNFTTGDTRPDIVVADDTGRVVLRTRTASNSFNAETVLRSGGVGDRVEDMAIGDFDGDGDSDLAVGLPGSQSSAVLPYVNRGNGVFDARPSLPTGPELSAIAVGNLNGDNRSDLAVVGIADATRVQTYLSLNVAGPLSFASGLNQPFANGTGVAIGDVDQDGDRDVVVSSGNGYTVVYRTNPGAVLSREEYRIEASRLTLANVDGEAAPDIIGINPSGVSIGFNYGSGSFAGAPLITQSPSEWIGAFVAANIDSDSDDDVLTFGAPGSGLLLHRNLGGYYQLPENMAQFDPEGVAVGDVNGDRRPDIAMLDEDTGRIMLRMADPLGGFLPETQGLQLTQIIGRGFVISDIDKDGLGDAVFQRGARTIGVARGTSANGGRFETPTLYVFDSEQNTLPGFAVGDLNADTYPEIAVMEWDQVGVLVNDARGGFSPVVSRLVTPIPETGYFGSMKIAQIEGGASSRMDLVYRDGTGLAWLRNTSTSGASIAFAQGAGWSGLNGGFLVADFDGDGDDDLFAELGDTNVGVVKNEGAAGFVPMTPFARRQNSTGAIGRIDGNLTPDILVTVDGADRTDDFATLMNIGNGNFLAADRVVHREVETLTMMRAGELTGDGLQDLVVIGHDQGKVSRLTNTGAGLSAAQVFNAGTTWGTDLAIGNFNGAGLNDILVLDGDRDNRRLMLLAANAQGGYSAPVRVWVEPSGAPFSFTAMATGDVDRDGDLDAVLIQWDTGRFVVVRNNGASAWDTYSDVQTVPNPTAIVLADLDGDGDLDAAISGGGGQGGVAFHYNAPPGLPPGRFSPFDPQAAIGGMNTPQTLAVGDLDGDQRLDLAVGLGGPGAFAEVQLLKNTSASGVIAFTRTNTQRLSTQNNEIPTLQVVDVDGDGRRDVVAGQQATVTVFRNVASGSSYTIGGSQTIAARGWWVAPLNVNGDGISDFVGMAGDGTVSTVVSLKRTEMSVAQIQVSDLITSPFHTKLRAQIRVANAGFLKYSSIGDGDFALRNTGPFYQPGTFVGASVQPDDSVLLTFDFAARLGAWDSTDNGNYFIDARSNAFTTPGGISFPLTNQSVWSNYLWFNAPTAERVSESVTDGGTFMEVTVRYIDAASTQD